MCVYDRFLRGAKEDQNYIQKSLIFNDRFLSPILLKSSDVGCSLYALHTIRIPGSLNFYCVTQLL